MSGCSCESNVFDGMSPAYRRALVVVIGMNAVMFAVELAGGLIAGSLALVADSLDFLADTLTYGLSLAVIGMSVRARATAALVKGGVLMLTAAWVVVAAAMRFGEPTVPDGGLMALIALLAMAVNLGAALVLSRWRDGDANVRSVWLCSRNDALGNVLVMLAGGAVIMSGSPWPDLLVALFLAGLFLHSATGIIRQALAERAAG